MRARTLSSEEWDRADSMRPLLELCHPSMTDVVVVESSDRIVASLGVLQVPFLEGIWIDPDHRNAGVCRALRRKAFEVCRNRAGTTWAYVGAADETVRNLLTRMDAAKVEMDLWVLAMGKNDLRED